MFTEQVKSICRPDFYKGLTLAFQETDSTAAIGIMSKLWGKAMYSNHNLPWRGRIVLDTGNDFLDYFKEMEPIESGRLQEDNSPGDGIQEPTLSQNYPIYKVLRKLLPKPGDKNRLGDFSLKREKELVGGSYDGIYVDFLVLEKNKTKFEKFTFGLGNLPNSIKLSPVDIRCFTGLNKFKHQIGNVQCSTRGCGLWFPEAPLNSLKHPRICKCGGLIHTNLPTECYSGSLGGYYENGKLKTSRYQSLRICDKCKRCWIVSKNFEDQSKLN